MIEIVDYNTMYQEGIDIMMKEIASEFKEPIVARGKHKKTTTLDSHWIALNDAQVIGGVGVLVIEPQFGILKRMMVKKEYRGSKFGISEILLKTAIEWCLKNKITTIYLGTMHQFKAAQAFYKKNGFDQISEKELPKTFMKYPLDKVFFKLDLSSGRSL